MFNKDPQEFDYIATVHVTVECHIPLSGNRIQVDDEIFEMTMSMETIKDHGIEVVADELQSIERA